jgi:hypothetical protein
VPRLLSPSELSNWAVLPVALAVAVAWGAGCATPGIVNWQQAAGPDGTWRVNVADAPTTWSVAANQNILWKAPLPSEGQGGIAVWGDSLLSTTGGPAASVTCRDRAGCS